MYTLKHRTTFRGRPNNAVRSEGLRVTVNSRGSIYINNISWQALGCPEAVELMFDQGRRVIGLKPVDAWQPNSFPVRHKTQSTGKVIHANPFCVHFAIRPLRTAIFNQAHIDEDGVMSLPLDSITAVSTGSR